MEEIGFERVSHFIALSSIGKNNTNQTAKTFYLPKQSVLIQFSNYVKSQVHLNIVTLLFQRSISDYTNAYKAIINEEYQGYNFSRVLKYFYNDIAKALINNKEELAISIEVDVSDDPIEYSVASVQGELSEIVLEKDPYKKLELLRNCKYSMIFDYVDSVAEYNSKSLNFAIASILLQQLEKDKVECIRINLE